MHSFKQPNLARYSQWLFSSFGQWTKRELPNHCSTSLKIRWLLEYSAQRFKKHAKWIIDDTNNSLLREIMQILYTSFILLRKYKGQIRTLHIKLNRRSAINVRDVNFSQTNIKKLHWINFRRKYCQYLYRTGRNKTFDTSVT